jgi:hypothetical protein
VRDAVAAGEEGIPDAGHGDDVLAGVAVDPAHDPTHATSNIGLGAGERETAHCPGQLAKGHDARRVLGQQL